MPFCMGIKKSEKPSYSLLYPPLTKQHPLFPLVPSKVPLRLKAYMLSMRMSGYLFRGEYRLFNDLSKLLIATHDLV